MEVLTEQEILDDIEDFKDRISAARQKLENLPEGYLSYSKHRKREKVRRDLQDNIDHIQKLIKIAEEALA